MLRKPLLPVVFGMTSSPISQSGLAAGSALRAAAKNSIVLPIMSLNDSLRAPDSFS